MSLGNLYGKCGRLTLNLLPLTNAVWCFPCNPLSSFWQETRVSASLLTQCMSGSHFSCPPSRHVVQLSLADTAVVSLWWAVALRCTSASSLSMGCWPHWRVRPGGFKGSFLQTVCIIWTHSRCHFCYMESLKLVERRPATVINAVNANCIMPAALSQKGKTCVLLEAVPGAPGSRWFPLPSRNTKVHSSNAHSSHQLLTPAFPSTLFPPSAVVVSLLAPHQHQLLSHSSHFPLCHPRDHILHSRNASWTESRNLCHCIRACITL